MIEFAIAVTIAAVVWAAAATFNERMTLKRNNPKLWITYRTTFAFQHVLKPDPAVVDQSCLAPHEHIAELKVSLTKSEQWVDFKEIKQRIEAVISRTSGNLGVKDTETIVEDLRTELCVELDRLPHQIKVELRETSKYGVDWQ